MQRTPDLQRSYDRYARFRSRWATAAHGLPPATTGRTGSRNIASPLTGSRSTADVGRRPFAGSKSRKQPLDFRRRQSLLHHPPPQRRMDTADSYFRQPDHQTSRYTQMAYPAASARAYRDQHSKTIILSSLNQLLHFGPETAHPGAVYSCAAAAEHASLCVRMVWPGGMLLGRATARISHPS